MKPGKSVSLPRIVILLQALFALLYIWFNTIPVSQDLYGWAYQGYVLGELFRGGTELPFSLSVIPVPNTIVVLILGLFNLLFSPMVAVKLVMTFLVLLFFSFIVYNRSLWEESDQRWVLAAYLSIYTISFGLMMGFLSFIAGVALMFFGLGYMLKPKGGKTSIIAILTLLIYLMHGFVFLLWSAMVVLFLLEDRKWKMIPALLKIFVIPGVLIILYLVYSPSDAPLVATDSAHPSLIMQLAYRVWRMFVYYSLFFNIYPLREMLGGLKNVLVAANSLLAIVSGGVLLYSLVYGISKYNSLSKRELYLFYVIVVLGAVMILSPKTIMQFLGIYGRIAFILLIVSLFFIAGKLPRVIISMLRVLLVCITLLQVVYHAGYLVPVSRLIEDQAEEAREYLHGGSPVVVDDGILGSMKSPQLPSEVMSWEKVLGMPSIYPTMHLYEYVGLRDSFYVPTFSTSLLVDSFASIGGQWREGDFFPPAWAGSDILMFGEPGNRSHLEAQYEPKYKVIHKGRLYTVMSMNAGMVGVGKSISHNVNR